MTDTGLEIRAGAQASLVSRAVEWLARNPIAFPVLLICVTCLIVGAINPSFWQIANLFDILRASAGGSSRP